MADTILITTEWFDRAPNRDEALAKIARAGFEVRVSGHTGILGAEELRGMLAGIRGCVAGIDRFTRDAIADADALAVISRTGVGYERIDLEACTERGIVVTTSAGSNADAVAEFTIGLMLAAARQIPAGDASMRAGRWESGEMMGGSVVGKRLGIVGLGTIGARVARLARGLRMDVEYFDVVRKPGLETTGVATFMPFEELLGRSDFITVHVPLTPASHKLFSDRALRAMQPHAFLINTARGPVVDDEALVRAVDAGWIRGAALDVFDPEPPLKDGPLLRNERIIVTPHIAGSNEDARRRNLGMAIDNLLGVLGGERPASVVNPRVYETGAR